MASFGSYETVQELVRSGYVTVSKARRINAGADASAAVVKSFTPDAAVHDSAAAECDAFFDRASLQQRAAKAARHWAPIHDVGRSGEGVYYVTDFYPQTMQRLVSGRVKISAVDLHALMTGIVAGLQELKSSCGRAHLNLKPTNVLFSGREIIADHIILTDPGSESDADKKTPSESKDIPALGNLIHLIVLHKPFQERGGWPIKSSDAWSHLGKMGEKWLDLCNRLLSPVPSQSKPTLDWVEAELQKLRPAKAIVTPARIGVAAAVLLAIVAIFPIRSYLTHRRQVTQVSGQRDWISALETDEFADAAANDQALTDIQNQLTQCQTDAERIKRGDQPSGGMDAALARINHIHDELNAWVRQQGIPAQISAMTTAKLGSVAAALTALASDIDLPDAQTPKSITTWQKLKSDGTLDDIQTKWQAITSSRRVVEPLAADATLNAFVVKCSHYESDSLDAGHLSDLPGELASLQTEGEILVAAINSPDWANVDQTALRSDNKNPMDPSDWKRLVHADYRRINDPIAAAGFTPDQIDGQYAQNIQKLLDLHRKGADVCHNKLTALEQAIKDAAAIPRVTKNQNALAAKVTALAAMKSQLEDAISEAELSEQFGKWLAQIRGKATVVQETSTPLNEAWTRVRDGMLQNVDAIADEKHQADQKALQDKINNYQNFLTALDGQFAVPEIGAGSTIAWGADLSGELQQRRLNVLAQAVKDEDLDHQDWSTDRQPDFQSKWSSLKSDFDSQCKKIDQFVQNADALKRLLAQWYAYSERSPQDGSIADMQGALADLSAGAGKLVQNSEVQSLLTRADDRKAISTDTSDAELRQWASDTANPDRAWAAWIQLGQVENKRFASPAQIVAEASLRANLDKALAAAADQFPQTRLETMRHELYSDPNHRWTTSFAAPVADADLKQALDPDVLKYFGLDLKTLPTKDRMNNLLLQLRAVAANKPADGADPNADLYAAIDQAVKPLANSRDPDEISVRNILSRWRQPQADSSSGPPADLFHLTKGNLGDDSITYAMNIPTPPRNLTFHKLATAEGGPTVYLCTTAVSAGLFFDVVDQRHKWGTFANYTDPNLNDDDEQNDNRGGPRTWKWITTQDKTKGMQLPATWLHPHAKDVADYPPALVDPNNPHQLNNEKVPASDDPIQYLSPTATCYFTQVLMQCRLPTVAEWHLASAANGTQSDSNFRDNIFKSQRDYIASLPTLTGDPNFPPEQLRFPDFDCFGYDTAAKKDDQAEIANSASDNFLWFRPVETGNGIYQNLTGNVAQFVWNIDTPPKVDANWDDPAAPDAVGKIISGKIAVIGASAISPPEMKPDVPQPVTIPDAAGDPLNNRQKGYSDVGIRLAFGYSTSNKSRRDDFLKTSTDWFFKAPTSGTTP